MIYDVSVINVQYHECHQMYNVMMKKDFVLDRRDGRVVDRSGFNAKSCVGDRVRFPHRSNLTQVANVSLLLRR